MATIYRLGSESGRAMYQRYREMGAAQGLMPGREEGRRNSEHEQEQDEASQQLVSSASGGCNEGTPASSSELDLLRVRGALGERGGAGNRLYIKKRQVLQRMTEIVDDITALVKGRNTET